MAEKIKYVLALPGDGIGPEVVAPAIDVLHEAARRVGIRVNVERALIGGAAIDATGDPLPDATLEKAKAADAVLLGAVGGPKWDALPMSQRPERGLLRIRAALGLFANLRPALLLPPLAHASSLKAELVSGLDLLIVRELTGGIYFGTPRGVSVVDGERRGINTEVYTESEIARIARIAFELARRRSRRLCSVDKANVLEVTQLWREVVTEVGRDYPDVALSHMYVDNAGMQLVRQPKQFDVMVTNNMFGDILSDVAAMLTGSLGMLPSASLAADGRGLYEPVHGSAPDIAGRNLANPLATMLSVAMMFRYTFDAPAAAVAIEHAVLDVLASGLRTRDILTDQSAAGSPEPRASAREKSVQVRAVDTHEMAAAVLARLQRGDER